MIERSVAERDGAAIGWIIGFLASLLGVLALPVFRGSDSILEIDGGEIGPFLVFAAVLVVLALTGKTSPTMSGAASGVIALVAIALTMFITISIFLTVLLGDFGGTPGWGGGVFAAIATAATGFMAVIVSGKHWRSVSPTAWTTVSVAGAIASALMIIGLVIPEDGLSLGATLGFDAHPLVGLAMTLFLASLAAIGIAGFAMGRWGLGLLLGFFGFVFIGWVSSRSGDQSATTSWSGVRGGTRYHTLTVLGFWSSLGLLAIHAMQQYSTQPFPHAASRSAVASTGKSQSAGWAPDPFGRFEMRYFDGRAWTAHVVKDGEQGSDPAHHDPPVDLAAAWHADPFGRHEQRYFDGTKWTSHVATGEVRVDDPPNAAQPSPARASSSDDSRQVAETESTTASSVQGGAGAWAPDPFGRFEMRYFDGRAWTAHAVKDGEQGSDPAQHDSPSDPSAAWRLDPFGRHEQRYFDGTKWTSYVATGGVRADDMPTAPPPSAE